MSVGVLPSGTLESARFLATSSFIAWTVEEPDPAIAAPLIPPNKSAAKNREVLTFIMIPKTTDRSLVAKNSIQGRSTFPPYGIWRHRGLKSSGSLGHIAVISSKQEESNAGLTGIGSDVTPSSVPGLWPVREKDREGTWWSNQLRWRFFGLIASVDRRKRRQDSGC